MGRAKISVACYFGSEYVNVTSWIAQIRKKIGDIQQSENRYHD